MSVVSLAGASIVTTLAPQHGQVALHTWGEPGEGCTVGQLTIAPPEPPPFKDVTVSLGCVYAPASTFPAQVDVPSECLGSDDEVDVLLVGYDEQISHGIPTSVPVTALVGRARMVDGHAEVTGTWESPVGFWNVDVDTSLVPGATGVGVRLVDGLIFFHDNLGALPYDGVRVRAGFSDSYRFAQLYVSGAPDTVQLLPDDFLPEVAPGYSLLQRAPLAVAWTSTQVSDAVRIEVGWQAGGTSMSWTAVLPPSTTQLVFPHLPDAGILLPVVGDQSHPVNFHRTYVDADEVVDFDAVLAGGLYLLGVDGYSSTVAPTSRRIRTTTDGITF